MNIVKLIFTATLFAVVGTSSVFAHDDNQVDHIAVVGAGEIEAEPDQATLRVRVSAQKPDMIAAKQLADERYAKVLAVLKRAGIKKTNIKATQVIAQPQYEWNNSKRIYKGELVSRSLSITINDLEKVSPLMQALVENDVSSIDGLDTGFQDRAGLLELALAAAADDAKSKATFLANRLGRKLGSAYLITEHNAQAPRQARGGVEMMRSSAMVADAPPEMFGTQKISARVNVKFNLL